MNTTYSEIRARRLQAKHHALKPLTYDENGLQCTYGVRVLLPVQSLSDEANRFVHTLDGQQNGLIFVDELIEPLSSSPFNYEASNFRGLFALFERAGGALQCVWATLELEESAFRLHTRSTLSLTWLGERRWSFEGEFIRTASTEPGPVQELVVDGAEIELMPWRIAVTELPCPVVRHLPADWHLDADRSSPALRQRDHTLWLETWPDAASTAATLIMARQGDITKVLTLDAENHVRAAAEAIHTPMYAAKVKGLLAPKTIALRKADAVYPVLDIQRVDPAVRKSTTIDVLLDVKPHKWRTTVVRTQPIHGSVSMVVLGRRGGECWGDGVNDQGAAETTAPLIHASASKWALTPPAWGVRQQFDTTLPPPKQTAAVFHHTPGAPWPTHLTLELAGVTDPNRLSIASGGPVSRASAVVRGGAVVVEIDVKPPTASQQRASLLFLVADSWASLRQASALPDAVNVIPFRNVRCPLIGPTRMVQSAESATSLSEHGGVMVPTCPATAIYQISTVDTEQANPKVLVNGRESAIRVRRGQAVSMRSSTPLRCDSAGAVLTRRNDIYVLRAADEAAMRHAVLSTPSGATLDVYWSVG